MSETAPSNPVNATPFENFSGLGFLLRTLGRSAPALLTADERSRLAGSAETAVTSLSLGVAAIGKLLIHVDAAQLMPDDLYSLGDLLASMGEAINEAADIGQRTENAQPLAAAEAPAVGGAS